MEKDIAWSCDGPSCKDAGEGSFPEKSRSDTTWVLRKRPILNDGTGIDVSTMGTEEGVTGTFVEIVSSRRRHLPHPRYSFQKQICES